MNDKILTEKSNFCKHLLHGDVTVADRGCGIAELVTLSSAFLHIPSFTRGKAQLCAAEVHETRELQTSRSMLGGNVLCLVVELGLG